MTESFFTRPILHSRPESAPQWDRPGWGRVAASLFTLHPSLFVSEVKSENRLRFAPGLAPPAPEGRRRVAGGKRSAAPGQRPIHLTTKAPAGATHLEITNCDFKIEVVGVPHGRARLLPSRTQPGPSHVNSHGFVRFPLHIRGDMHRKAPFSIHVRRNMHRKVHFPIHVHPEGSRS
jgi:hypothetical protein